MKFAVTHLAVVSLFALLCGVWVTNQYLENPDPLWSDVIHDRNAHLQTGMSFAMDLPRGKFISIIRQSDRSQTWPPLHDTLLVGVALIFGGLDERAAVFPSILGYILTIIFAYLLVKKVSGRFGEVGGYLAAFFVAISPAIRGYAADVMLESLGAAFTLIAFWCYLRVLENPDYKRGRSLAWSLSGLFFLKYNYWLLVLFAVTGHGVWFYRKEIFTWLKARYQERQIHGFLKRQLRHPVTYILAVMLAILAVIHYTKGFTVPIGKGVQIKSGSNLVTAIWWILVLRLGVWYRRRGWQEVRDLSSILLALVHWHAIPVSIWFLWPRRLNTFIWFSNPTANAGERPDFDPLGGYKAYLEFFRNDYLAEGWQFWLAMALLGLGLLVVLVSVVYRRKELLHKGAAVLVLFLGMSIFLTCQHPNRKSRFLHSWIPLVWVLGGVGVTGFARIGTRKIPIGVGVGTIGVGVIVALSFNEIEKKPHAQEARSYTNEQSALTLSRYYLPKLEGSQHVAIFCDHPSKFFSGWTHHQYWQRQQVLETEIKGWLPGSDGDFEPFLNWINTTQTDQIVSIEISEKSPLYREVFLSAKLNRYTEYLRKQDRFRLVEEVLFDELGCIVRIYERKQVR